jgi:hypothetical protein
MIKHSVLCSPFLIIPCGLIHCGKGDLKLYKNKLSFNPEYICIYLLHL